jgi:hypothetical protein
MRERAPLLTKYLQVGSFVVSYITSPTATWTSLVLLLCLHLGTNYRAVRAVQMTSLNRQRANIVFSTVLDTDPDLHSFIERQSVGSAFSLPEEPKGSNNDEQLKFLRPSEVAQRERIFERDGILRWRSSPQSSFLSSPQKLGFCRIGCSLQDLKSSLLSIDSNSISTTTLPISQIIDIFKDEDYMLATTTPVIPSIVYSKRKKFSSSSVQMTVILKKGCTTTTQLKAWTHALLVAYLLNKKDFDPLPRISLTGGDEHDIVLLNRITSSTLFFLNHGHRFDKYTARLVDIGWDLDVAALETSPGRRVQIESYQGPG